MKKKANFVLWCLLFFCNTNAQQFVFDLMEKVETKQLLMKDAATSAKHFFDSVGTGRGTGYKQFQRWLYEKQFHTDANGYSIDAETEWNIWNNTNPVNNYSATNNARTQANTWSELGPWGWSYTSSWNPGTGRLTDIAIHPLDTTKIYVTSPGGGIWKSSNSGNTWTPLQDYNSTWMNMYSITIDPSNQNIIYAGNSSGSVMKSVDAGATWSTLSVGANGIVRKILVHPTNSNIIFVCSSAGVHRSINGGTSFTLVHNIQKEDIEFKTDNANIMVATGNTSIIRSTDAGVTWTTLGIANGITHMDRSLVAVTPANPNYVYIVQANGSAFGRMYLSIDGGINFSTTVVGSHTLGTNYFCYSPLGNEEGGLAWYDMALCVSPTNANEVYIAGIIVWRSTNAGTSFVAQTEWSYPNTTGYNHADVHGLQWINNTLYSNTDGGIFKSTDRADNWTSISTGLGIKQFYRIACSPTNGNVITGGTQDNGSVTRKPLGNWVDWLGADGMEGLVSPTNANNIWGTTQNGSIFKSIDGGNNFIPLAKPSNGNWVTPLAIHPTNQNTLYGGWTGFYKSIDGGTNWTLLSGTSIIGTVTDFAVAPSDTNYIYVSRGTSFFTSTDAGVTWTENFLTDNVSDICVHRTIPTKVYITFSSSVNNVLVSTDAGANFTPISTGLPTVAARSIVVENNAVQGVYVGMNTGVYYKNDTMSNWLNYTANLPTVAVNELEIHYTSNKLRVATYGRGIWETLLFNASTLPIQWLQFTATKQAIGIALHWKVSGETVNTLYELQRSENGVNFTTIKTVPAALQSIATYNDLDGTAFTNTVYYRIKEKEGTRFSYSNVVSVRASKNAPMLVIKPNPVINGKLQFAFNQNSNSLYEVNIVSLTGQVMLVHKTSNALAQIDITQLPNGVYHLVVKQDNTIYKERFIKGN